MKFINFINESNEELENIIKKYVKKEFFLALKKSGGLLYRGSPKTINDYEIITTRKDRIPKDTPQKIHDKLVNAFKKKFGWGVRDDGVFTTSNIYYTHYEGYRTYIFFPIGSYKYVWSLNIEDLYNYMGDASRRLRLGNYNKYYLSIDDRLNDLSDKEIDILVKDTILSYKITGLEKAIESENEVIFKCDKYLLVNIHGKKIRKNIDTINNLIINKKS